MLKKLVIISMLVICCYCEENKTDILTEETRAIKAEILTEETRAIKKKTVRFLVMVAIFVLSKIAILKAASFFVFFAFFQKLFSVGGVLLTYFMKNQLAMAAAAAAAAPPPAPSPAPSAAPPSPSYGSPIDYNTIGYSYGPPEHEAAFNAEGPSLTDFGGPFNWILKKP